MFCCQCSEVYFSSIMDNDYNPNKQLVTWEKYHCSAVINDCIKCPKCKIGKFFLNLNENYLNCDECLYNIAPEEMKYNCLVCKKDFSSKLKIYNPIEFHIIKVSIKNALLLKIPAKPDYLPCCKMDTKNVQSFFHKKECSGILYSGKWINNNIIVCSKCKMLSEVEKFIWTCTICSQRFKSKISSLDGNLNKITLNNNKNNNNNLDDKISSNSNNNNSINSLTKDSNESKSSKNSILNTISQNNENSSNNKSQNPLTNSFEGVSGITNLIINNNININNINLAERTNSTGIGSNQSSNSNISSDLQNLLKNKTIDIDIENIKLDPNKLKSIMSNFDKGIESNPGYSSRKFTIDKNSRGNNVLQSQMIENDLSPNSRNILTSRNSKENINNRSPPDFIYISKNIKANLVNLNPINNQANSNKKNLSPNARNINLTNLNNNMKNINLANYHSNNDQINNSNNKNQSIDFIGNSKSARDSNFEKNDIESFNQNMELENNYDSRENENLKTFDCEDFKFIIQIGEGSFGKIYLVEDKNKIQFSMKKIIANDEIDMENFMQEYELVNKVRHKNILRIHSICRRKLDSTTHALYVLMEKAVTDWDKEIKARQNQKKFYLEKELFNVLGQLTDALAFLQNKNISHRDIKPQNVLLFREGSFKIADFGEAKKISIIETSKQLSTLRGTELYMSPLLFNGLRTGQNDIKHNSFKSDVFSLGFCLYYAATLNIHCLYDIRRETDTFTIGFKIGRALRGRYSEKLVNVLVKMLDINENNRFDFIELQNFLNASS